ncbi:MAG: ATP synthase F1 subunit gamma [Schleiferiaceae bacterium]
MQITSAMKMVSAAKLKRAQDASQQMRPYAEKLQEILENLSSTLDTSENAFSAEREVERVLLVPITANRGLCGGFNANIIKATKARIQEYKGSEVKILAVGKKANDGFKKSGLEIVENNIEIWNDLTFENSSEMAQRIMDGYLAGEYDKVEIIYNHFKNAAVQQVMTEQFLPVASTEVEGEQTAGEYIFEPGKMEILEDLIPKSLKTQVFKALLDSNASEHGARMTAMHKATDNANDLRSGLKLEYNKARQASITNEILEIVGGAEALNG